MLLNSGVLIFYESKVKSVGKSKQLNNNSKPIVVFFFSLIATAIFILSTLFATSVCEKYYGLVIGVILMLVAIPLHCLGNKTEVGYIFSFLVNSVANGFSLSAYYCSKNIALNFTDMFKSCVMPLILLLVANFLLLLFPEKKMYICAPAVAIGCIMLIAFMVSWIKQGTLFFSLGFFTMLLSLFYHCVVWVTANNRRPVLKDISFGSFGAFIIISFVVVFILTEGDIIDGLDLDIGGEGKSNKAKHK